MDAYLVLTKSDLDLHRIVKVYGHDMHAILTHGKAVLPARITVSMT